MNITANINKIKIIEIKIANIIAITLIIIGYFKKTKKIGFYLPDILDYINIQYIYNKYFINIISFYLFKLPILFLYFKILIKI